jgi:regulator of sigma E protease
LPEITYLLVTIVSFVLVLGVVVVVHEMGHFWAARWCNVAIEAFSVGWGKSLWEIKDRRGVRWKLARWPIGGFVKFVGDENAISAAPTAGYADPQAKAEARAQGILQAMPVGVRALVSVAGPAANFLFTIAVLAVVFMAFGRNVTDVGALAPRLDSIAAGSAAEKSGLKAGDVVIGIGARPIASYVQLQEAVKASPAREMDLLILRDQVQVRLKAIPDAIEQIDETGAKQLIGRLGVQRIPARSELVFDRAGPLEAIGLGAQATWRMVSAILGYLGDVGTGKRSADQLSGPIGIADVTGQVANSSLAEGGQSAGARAGGWVGALILLAATLSVAVGLTNLLPIPVLDGGHLLFYGIEAVLGRPLGPKAQALAYNVGLLMVGSIFLLATWNDLHRLIERLTAV